MPGLMFQDVVSPRAESKGEWYTLPLSCLIHTTVIAVVIVIPVLAPDVLPTPRALIQYVSPYMPVVPQAPAMRRAASPRAIEAAPGAPVVAPDVIGVEPGLIFQPGDIETTGLETIVGGFSATLIAAEAPPAPVAPSGPVVVGGNIKPPARTKYVVPAYPEMARRNGVQGVVILEAIIGADGKVDDARVLRSNPLLDQAALAAVRAWEYSPTLLNGRATPVIMTVTVQFTLK